MNFVRYDGMKNHSRRSQPHKMAVNQIIERKGVKKGHLSMLRRSMRIGMAHGMEFSFAEEGDVFAIRRDK